MDKVLTERGGDMAKFRRLPKVKKFDGVSLTEEHNKVVEEFYEWAQAYAVCRRNADMNKMTREDFAHLLSETFDLAQASQQFIHIATKNHGKYYAVTENNVYSKGIEKNAVRGYYEKEE